MTDNMMIQPVRVLYGRGMWAGWLDRKQSTVYAATDFQDIPEEERAGAFYEAVRGQAPLWTVIVIYGPCVPAVVEVIEC